MEAANILHLRPGETDSAGVILGAFQHQMHHHIIPVRLGHKQAVHQRMGENFRMGITTHIGQQSLAVGWGGAGAEDESTHYLGLRRV